MKQELIDLQKSIDEGRLGNSVWIPLHFPKMGESVGVGKKMYTLIGGMSGTGKTAFTDLAYVIGPYSWMLKNKDTSDVKVKILYRSMERSQTFKLAKWVSMRLYIKYNILMDVPELLGWGVKKSKVSQEIYDKVVESFDYFNEMLDHIEIIDGTMNPTGILKHVEKYANTVGKIEVVPYLTKEGIQRSKKVYIPNDPKLITLIVEDHLGKLKGEHLDGKFYQPQSKDLLDRMSDLNGTTFRDFYGFSPVAVSQFNRGLEDTTRRTKTDLSPLPSDFKGSGNTYEDADVVLALYNPYKLDDKTNLGYRVSSFVTDKGHNRFRSCYVLKNSYGNDDVAYGYQFLGEIGMMKELPKASDITNYKQYL